MSAIAAEAKIAIASNFTIAAKEIAAQFAHDTPHKTVLIFGSTGKLYTQIISGAPFDVYLGADQARPQKAESGAFGISGTRFTYAIGRLVLYSPDPALIDATPDILRSKQITKLAIANPRTAPYGKAAMETLIKLGLYDRLKPDLIMGENIAQTYQFIATGNVPLGFVANSQIHQNKRGSKWSVAAHFHTPIRQDGVLLQHGANNIAAKAFLHYLKGHKARAILLKYGYAVED